MSVNQVLCKALDSDTGIGTTGRDDKLISRVFVILSKDNLLPLAWGKLSSSGESFTARTSIILRVLRVLFSSADRSLHLAAALARSTLVRGSLRGYTYA